MNKFVSILVITALFAISHGVKAEEIMFRTSLVPLPCAVIKVLDRNNEEKSRYTFVQNLKLFADKGDHIVITVVDGRHPKRYNFIVNQEIKSVNIKRGHLVFGSNYLAD